MSSKFSKPYHPNHISQRQYEKHIRTLLDEVLFLYYKLFKHSSVYEELNYDFTEFSGIFYTLESQNDIPEFVSSLKESIEQLDGDEFTKHKLLDRIDALFRYYQRGVEEGLES